jgi:hypothetical protein
VETQRWQGFSAAKAEADGTQLGAAGRGENREACIATKPFRVLDALDDN